MMTFYVGLDGHWYLRSGIGGILLWRSPWRKPEGWAAKSFVAVVGEDDHKVIDRYLGERLPRSEALKLKKWWDRQPRYSGNIELKRAK